MKNEEFRFGGNSLCGASAGSRVDCGPHGSLGATPALCSGSGGRRETWSFPELRRGPGEAGRRLAAVEQGQMDHVFEGMRAAGKSPDPAWHRDQMAFSFLRLLDLAVLVTHWSCLDLL